MKVLIIEDDLPVAELVAASVTRGGHAASIARDGPEGLLALFEERPDLVILDLGLPGMDGFEVIARLRQLTDTPVIVVSGRVGELEKVRASTAGADDYVTKPFGVQELLARVNALARRRVRTQLAEAYDDGVLRIDVTQGEAAVDGRSLGLTPLELRMLWAFASHAGRTLAPEQLLRLVWGDEGHPRERVKVYVGYLRGKLAGAGLDGTIATIRGFGYRFERPARM